MIKTSIRYSVFAIRLFGIRYSVFAFVSIRSIRYSSFFTIRRPLNVIYALFYPGCLDIQKCMFYEFLTCVYNRVSIMSDCDYWIRFSKNFKNHGANLANLENNHSLVLFQDLKDNSMIYNSKKRRYKANISNNYFFNDYFSAHQN